MSGESTMKITVFVTPATMMVPGPPAATAAPTKPPIRACEEEVGSPSHQVRKFHATAASSAASTTDSVTAAGSTVPLAMVRATCTPNTAKATKLKNAAHVTAQRGGSTRVLTTVATELAASWKPLLKSKASATAMIARTARGS